MPFKRGPWTVNETILRFKSSFVEVNEDKVISPQGEESTFTLVRLKPGVSILPIDDEEFVYLVREYRYAIEQYCVEAVSGAIDENESDEDAARRELREELGIVAQELIDLGIVNPLTSQLHAPARLFVAKGLTFVEAQPDPFEIIEMVKMKLSEAVKLVIDSSITHAPSSVLILKVNQWLKKC